MDVVETVLARMRAAPPKTKGGDLDALLATARADRAVAESVRPFAPGDVVLDFGSGYGRLALAFAGTGVFYTGVDVCQKRVDYARKAFAGVEGVVFVPSNAHNARYNPNGGRPDDRQWLGCVPASFAAVFAVSVFTHEPDAAEVRSCLRRLAAGLQPGGVMLTTWLTEPDPGGAASTAHRAVHPRADVCEWLNAAGLSNVAVTGDGTVDQHCRILSVRQGAKS